MMHVRIFFIIIVILTLTACKSGNIKLDNIQGYVKNGRYISIKNMFSVEVPVSIVPKGFVPAHMKGRLPFRILDDTSMGNPGELKVVFSSRDGCKGWMIQVKMIPEAENMSYVEKELIFRKSLKRIRERIQGGKKKEAVSGKIIETIFDKNQGLLLDMKKPGVTQCNKTIRVGKKLPDYSYAFFSVFMFEDKNRFSRVTYMNFGSLLLNIAGNDKSKWDIIHDDMRWFVSSIQ